MIQATHRGACHASAGTTFIVKTTAGRSGRLAALRGQAPAPQGHHGGATWSVKHNLSGDVETRRPHRASIAVAGNHVHVANSRQFNAPDRTVTYWRSTNGGLGFSAERSRRPPAALGVTQHQRWSLVGGHPENTSTPNLSISHRLVANGPGGQVHVAAFDETNRRLLTVHSSDNGITWRSPLVAATLATNGIDTPFSIVTAGGYLHMLGAAAFTESAAGYMRMRVDGR